MDSEQTCQQCGHCCERWGWGQKGVIEDLVLWIANNREDILRHVSLQFSDGTRKSGSDISFDDLPRIFRIRYWQNPEGKPMHTCPFFQRSQDGRGWCAIHDCKPAVCLEFTPWNWQNHEFYGSCPACREKAP